MRRRPNAVRLRVERLEDRTAPAAGQFLREVWAGIPGTTVADLTSNPAYPGSPTSGAYLASLQTPAGAGPADYGERLRGTVTAPQTGAYTFWVEGDAEAQLFLSNADGPANRRLLASVPAGGTTAPGEWAKYPQQQSAPVRLVAGQRYYLEVLHKHGATGADHTAVGWQLPNGTLERAIPGTRLDPVLPTVQLWATDNAANRYGNTATFTATRDDDLGRDLTVTYAVGGSAAPGTDYAALPGTVVIPRGQKSATITLAPTARTSAAKQATLTLLAGPGYQLGPASADTATATIAAGAADLAGTPASPADWLTAVTWNLGGGATQTTVAVGGLPFAQAKRVVVPQATPNAFDVQARVRNTAPIAAGDSLLLTVWLRQADTTRPQASVGLGLQLASSPFTGAFSKSLVVGPDWTRFDLPFTSTQTFAANAAQVYFNFGAEAGAYDIGGVRLTDYGAAAGATAATPADWLTTVVSITGSYGTQSTVTAVNNSQFAPLAFTQAKRFQVASVPPNPWLIQAIVPTSAAIAAGDHLLLTAWVRSADPANATAVVDVGVQQVGGAYTVFGGDRFTATASWTRIDLPLVADQAYAAGGAQVYVNFGNRLQTVDVGGVTLTDTATGFSQVLLPQTENTYIGRDPAAAWRAAADQRIDQARKASLTVTVKDQNGVPVDGALVHAVLNRLAFDYGSAVAGDQLVNNNTASAVTYRNEILQLFNTATLENDLKWGLWQSNRQRSIDAANWVVANGLKLRGHNLVWPSWGNTPSSTGASSGTYNGVPWSASSNVPASQAEYNAHVTADGAAAANSWLANRILTHIADEVSTLAGVPAVWDVVNEPFSNHDFMDLLGQTSILDWYSQAHTSDPNALMALNDYGTVEGYGLNTAHQNSTFTWAQYAHDNATLGGRNGRLDDIGFQSHFSPNGLTGFDKVGQILDRFATLGTKMEVTEFDINTTDEQLQADYTRDYLKYIFSYPAMTGFVEWGFWEGRHWLPSGAMLRSDWTVKPNGQVWIDTTQKLWDTDASGTSWAGGQFAVRGFQGTYTVTVTYAGQTITLPATLTADGTGLTVTLPLKLPTATAVKIDDGSAQRSMVRSLTVTFSAPVTLDPGAFVLTPQGGGPAVPLAWTTALVNGVTVAMITFPGTPGGSIGDGNWVLRTDATKVHDAAGAFMPADRTDLFYRLYGDINGDRRVDNADFFLLKQTFLRSAGDPLFLSALDYDGSGVVDNADFFQFKLRFGLSI
jgi:endo-1,4-beta-xylanase